MIWHFFEVWALMLVAFAIGCPLGAAAYKLIAQSRLGNLQGDVADVVGDVVDGIKSRLGIGPVWRPEYRRLVERHGGDDMEDLGVLHQGFLAETAGHMQNIELRRVGQGRVRRQPQSLEIANRFGRLAIDAAG